MPGFSQITNISSYSSFQSVTALYSFLSNRAKLIEI